MMMVENGWKNMGMWAQNGYIDNHSEETDYGNAIVKLSHEASQKIGYALKQFESKGEFDVKNPAIEAKVKDILQEVFFKTPVAINKLNLDGEFFKNGNETKVSAYGTVDFELNGKKVNGLQFEKPEKFLQFQRDLLSKNNDLDMQEELSGVEME